MYTYSINLGTNEADLQDVLVKDPSAIAAQASRSQNNSAGSGYVNPAVKEGAGYQSGSNYKVVCWPAGCNAPLTVHSIGRSRRFLHVRHRNNKHIREIPHPPEGSDVSLVATDEDADRNRLKKEDSVETLQSVSEVLLMSAVETFKDLC